ncbi:Pex24p-domain-containing protein [Patellaria atrata CBS 101060]|uniref:Pex24p-domain-containing protein n=1 Tax=Patellaria atrata CBS 101060 TaxID=1346257 RepID=A0A9P4VVL3_9PEZI|nr:Pex24p-domain-containing protein [Patellaria atrata CBS 101060]
MSSTPSRADDNNGSHQNVDLRTPTVAAFSPSTLSHFPSVNKQRSTILVHQKSPLLVATPPQVTRALAYSHPFISPLNKFVGLLSWTTGDPWESFLLVASFWFITLYGDVVMRYAGPLVVVSGLILGMYTRRYSPLSSTGWTGEKGQGQKGHKRGDSEAGTRHHKSLDEIIDTLKLFTSRCNILLDPFLRFTDFLSTQSTATSATTRPALTTLFIRILFVTPIWIVLTLPPLYIITSKRVILTVGTLILSWHSRPARVSRIIMWRSKTVRKVCATITGLDIAGLDEDIVENRPPLPPRKKNANEVAASLAAKRRPTSPGIRFTFTLYENQRRWLGIGWTSSMLAYERASWTDEHLNAVPDKDHFELPEVEGGHARWRWIQGSEWRIEGTEGEAGSGDGDKADTSGAGWIYYDNKWRDGKRGQDGWGRYTRRRKWYRAAELVEVTPSTEITPSATPRPKEAGDGGLSEAETVPAEEAANDYVPSIKDDDNSSNKARKRRWFRRNSQAASQKSGMTGESGGSIESRRSDEDDIVSPPSFQQQKQSDWGLSDDAAMSLG